jgi:hypothetical protein
MALDRHAVRLENARHLAALLGREAAAHADVL